MQTAVLIPEWLILLGAALMVVAAIANVVSNIQNAQQKQVGSSTDTAPPTPQPEPHSVTKKKSTLKVKIKNTGAPLIVKNIIVDREQSNFLMAWTSPTQKDDKIGKKRVMEVEFALFKKVKKKKEAEGTFTLEYTDEAGQPFEQQARVKKGKLSLETPKQAKG